MVDERRKSGIGVSGVFEMLGLRKSRATSGVSRAPSETLRPRVPDPMERLQRPARDVARLMGDIPLFSALNARDRDIIAEFTHISRCHGGTPIWTAGDPGLWLLVMLEGRVEMRSRIGPGVEHMVRAHVKGDVVGLEAGLGAETYHLAAFATERSAVLRIAVHELRQVLAVGKPAAVKLFMSLGNALGDRLRAATIEVTDLLERGSVMPALGEAVSSDDLSKLLGGG